MASRVRSTKRVKVSIKDEIEVVKLPKGPRTNGLVGVREKRVPLSELVKHRTLWFYDGNIVLAVEDVCFKVHRSQLARLCGVFMDMFGAPGPGGVDEEMMEECVVVRMPDDAIDLTNFLDAIYNGHSFNFSTRSSTNFPAVAGVMRLATKYDCEVLRTRIYTSMRDQYLPNSTHLHFDFSVKATQHVDLILLANECDLRDLLPIYFYRLAFSPTGENVSLLTRDDQTRLMVGKAALLKRVQELLSKVLPGDIERACQSQAATPTGTRNKKLGRGGCREFLKTYWNNEICPGDGLPDALVKNPLDALGWLSLPSIAMAKYKERPSLRAGRGSTNRPPVCRECSYQLTSVLNDTKRSIQDSLSECFML